jgi:transposase
VANIGMIVLNYGEQIKESEEDLLTVEHKQTKGLLRRRVRFVRLLKSGECSSQAQAGERIGINSRQSEKLWKRYKEKGLQGLLVYPYKGRKPRITEDQVQSLKEELEKDNIQTLKQACAFVEQHDGQHFTVPGMHFIFKRFKIKKKTGRPTHHHRDEEGAEVLKKNAGPKAKL